MKQRRLLRTALRHGPVSTLGGAMAFSQARMKAINAHFRVMRGKFVAWLLHRGLDARRRRGFWLAIAHCVGPVQGRARPVWISGAPCLT